MVGDYRDVAEEDGAVGPTTEERKAMVYAVLAVLFVILAFALVRIRGRRTGRS